MRETQTRRTTRAKADDNAMRGTTRTNGCNRHVTVKILTSTMALSISTSEEINMWNLSRCCVAFFIVLIVPLLASAILLSEKDCKAIIEGDVWKCASKDCKAIIKGDVWKCASEDCKAIIEGDVWKCASEDCKAIVAGDVWKCTSGNCKAVIEGDVWKCD